MIALLHDNPTITDLNNCQYITDEQEHILRFIHWVYHDWLVDSEYETTTKPSFIIYYKNNYLNNENLFDISYYLSIKF